MLTQSPNANLKSVSLSSMIVNYRHSLNLLTNLPGIPLCSFPTLFPTRWAPASLIMLAVISSCFCAKFQSSASTASLMKGK